MGKTLACLSPEEFEELVEHVIDRRLNVWLIQLMDALTGSQEEDEKGLRSEFAVSLKCSLEQARSGRGTDLKTFRDQIRR